MNGKVRIKKKWDYRECRLITARVCQSSKHDGDVNPKKLVFHLPQMVSCYDGLYVSV